ncbi:hypothetical protein BGZ58_009199 [Dissophora ornata]|nr:hypothetical protein BGZ58_009199 [Dissophora ornata]
MATKTYVVKASDVAASKTTSTYVPKTTRASSVKSTTTTAAPAVSSSSSSSSSPVSATASSYSPEQMSFGGYQDSPAPISPYASAVAKTGGATGQEATTAGLKDAAIGDSATEDAQDWTRSFSGMATEAFESQVAELLMKPLDADDIEIKPDGLLYLPEIKYRRILNKAFGPGGKFGVVVEEIARLDSGRFVSTARGEQDYFNPNGLATASEGCKSNALMRCCKDLGIASELWDPSFIRKFKKQYCEEVFYMNSSTNKKKKLWKRKDAPDYEYPWVRSKRKRKWDNQGEDDIAIKRGASEADIHSTEENDNSGANTLAGGQNGLPAQTSADAVAAAAAIAAARANAMLVAQGKAQADTDGANAAGSKSAGPRSDAGGDSVGGNNSSSHGHDYGHGLSTMPIRESKERDEFVADIDINDVKHRYILTKGSVQTGLQRDTGADVTTRGKYYQDRSEATEKDPPLYLHITALTQEALDQAVKKVNELIEEAQNLVQLPPQRESFQPGSRSYPGPPRHQSFNARVAIGIESDRMFNVRAKIVGPGGQYVKHVQNETKTRVQLKGHGSGYLEVDTGRESDEPLYINILGNSQEDLDAAERLCKDLVETVRAEHERMKSRPPMQQEPYGHGRQYGGRSGYYNGGQHQRYQGGHQQYQQQPHQYGYNQQYQASPPPPHGGPTPPSNPPLPSGPPPPPMDNSASTAATATTDPASAGAIEAAADPSAQGYTYEQYEAYNQYYYQQQYYQQYGQYYQQAYAQPGTEQGQAAISVAGAPVTSDPALAYYGYAYAPPPPPPSEGAAAAPPSSSEAEAAAAAVPPPPPSGTSDSQP